MAGVMLSYHFSKALSVVDYTLTEEWWIQGESFEEVMHLLAEMHGLVGYVHQMVARGRVKSQTWQSTSQCHLLAVLRSSRTACSLNSNGHLKRLRRPSRSASC
eukprot:5333656-Amphidinium_carterae.1